MHTFFGAHVISSEFMADTVWEQFRFPRSKRKRIRKKWAKDRRNWRSRHVPWETFYHFRDGTIAAHPKMIVEMQRAIEKVNEATIQRCIDEPESFLGVEAFPPRFVASSTTNTADAMKQIIQRLDLSSRVILAAKPTYYVYPARLPTVSW